MDHRSKPRIRTVLKAEIRHSGGLINTPCTVRDLSDTGARIELPGDVTLPDRFDLYIEKRHAARPAVVKRRHGTEVGVAFLDVPPPEVAPAPSAAAASVASAAPAVRAEPAASLADRVSKLEAEHAVLQEIVRKLAAKLLDPK